MQSWMESLFILHLIFVYVLLNAGLGGWFVNRRLEGAEVVGRQVFLLAEESCSPQVFASGGLH